MARKSLTEHRPPTEQERRFAEEYWQCLDPSIAAGRAGYPDDVVRNAHLMLREDVIAAEVARVQAARSLRTHVTMDLVVTELSRVALCDPLDAFDVVAADVDEDGNPTPTIALKPLDKIPEDTRRAIESIEVLSGGGVKIKFANKLKALEMLTPHVEAMQPAHRKSESRTVQQQLAQLHEVLSRASERTKGLPSRMRAQTISSNGDRVIMEMEIDGDPPAEQNVTPLPDVRRE